MINRRVLGTRRIDMKWVTRSWHATLMNDIYKWGRVLGTRPHMWARYRSWHGNLVTCTYIWPSSGGGAELGGGDGDHLALNWQSHLTWSRRNIDIVVVKFMYRLYTVVIYCHSLKTPIGYYMWLENPLFGGENTTLGENSGESCGFDWDLCDGYDWYCSGGWRGGGGLINFNFLLQFNMDA